MGADGARVASIGALTRSRRLALGLTQQDLADQTGLSVSAIRDLEQGRRQTPRARSMADLVRVLDLDAGEVRKLVRASRARAEAVAQSGGQRTGPQPQADGLRLRVLGPLEAWRDQHRLPLGPPRQRAVLGLLAVEPGTLVHRETIIDELWGDDPPGGAVNLVQCYVGRLRRVLDPGRPPRDTAGLLVSAGTSYRLQVAMDQLDLLAFDALVDSARASLSAGDAVAACGLYDEARRMWRGAPMADVEPLRGRPAVTGLGRQRTAMLLEYAEAAAATGLHEQVLPYLWELVEREPLNEKAHAHLMITLAGAGRQAAALEVFEGLRQRLDDRLGVGPGALISAAHVRVLRQDVATYERVRQLPQVGDHDFGPVIGGPKS